MIFLLIREVTTPKGKSYIIVYLKQYKINYFIEDNFSLAVKKINSFTSNEHKKIHCDSTTFNFLLSLSKYAQILKVVNAIPISICSFFFNQFKSIYNSKTEKQFFNFVKSYLTAQQIRNGSTVLKIEKHIRPIITQLLNNTEFLSDHHQDLISIFGKNANNSSMSSQQKLSAHLKQLLNNPFAIKCTLLISELKASKNDKEKRELQIKIEKLCDSSLRR